MIYLFMNIFQTKNLMINPALPGQKENQEQVVFKKNVTSVQ